MKPSHGSALRFVDSSYLELPGPFDARCFSPIDSRNDYSHGTRPRISANLLFSRQFSVLPVNTANGVGLNVHEFLLTSFEIRSQDVQYPLGLVKQATVR